MKIIGINCFHADSSATLLINGEIISATEEERFTRIKHWAGVPLQSIKFCLDYNNLKITDIDCIVIGRDINAKMFKKIKYSLKNLSSSSQMIRHRLFSRNNNTKVKEEIVNFFGFCPPIEYVEHHICHLASAFYSSPFENSTLVSIDGSGDFSTIMIGKGEGSIIEVIESQDFPVSIEFCIQHLLSF